ncbi:MAG: hypothetical protein HZA54_05760 [Planctomycetes bacterium]|nr:hypothetical protein [Planctomycetota bacterium]
MSHEQTLDIIRDEYTRRQMMQRAYVTKTHCLGPCAEGNIVFAYVLGRGMWFRRMNTEPLIRDLMEYVDGLTRARAYRPPPPALAAQVFRRTTGDLPLPGSALGPLPRPADLPTKT